MKVNNTKRLTITLSTLCLASTLFCSANAHTTLKKGCEYASITHPLGAEMTMVGKPMVCTFAVFPNGKVGYQWVSAHSATHKVALNRPLKLNGTYLPTGAHVGATLDADNNVDAYIRNIHTKLKAVRDADNALGMEMQTSSANHVRLLKNIMQNSSLYEFNLGVQTVSPKLSHVLNSTLAFYQRQRTNILLAALVAKQHEVTTKAVVPFSTGKNSLLLHVHGKTIPFFQFVHDFHAQSYVQQCMIPLVRQGGVTLYQLHRAWNMLTILGNVNINNKLYRLHHCKSRSLKLNDRLHHAHLRSWHEAALLSAANRASTTPANTIPPVSMRATGGGITFFPECLDFSTGKQSQTAYATIAASPRERVLGFSPAQHSALAEHNKASTHSQLSVSTDAKPNAAKNYFNGLRWQNQHKQRVSAVQANQPEKYGDITMDAGKEVCVIDEAWDGVSFPHSISEFLRRGAQRHTNQPPVIITAMPADLANANVDVLDADVLEAIQRNCDLFLQINPDALTENGTHTFSQYNPMETP